MENHQKKTLVLLEGGHKTLIKYWSVSEVQKMVSDGRLGDYEFIFIQHLDGEEGEPSLTDRPNTLAIDPFKVIAIIDASTPALEEPSGRRRNR